jgi:hypothetical protein
MNNELKRQGEHRGDFTRDTFDPAKRFSRVLMQQGRVLLDADWNEQTSILLHNARSFAADVVGPHGGPADIVRKDGKVQVNCGFEIITAAGRVDALNLSPAENGRLKGMLGDTSSRQMLIGKGHYYVNGILCENDDYVLYSAQPDGPLPESTLDNGRRLVYLDVWERHVTHFQDGESDDPGIREVALGGPDTASRAKVIWQVKAMPAPNVTVASLKDLVDGHDAFRGALGNLLRPGTGKLMARAKKPTGEVDDCACVTSPESRYRGVENQLYRVEIHAEAQPGSPATFKWSRENGSVVFPISKIGGSQVTVGHLGRDERYGLEIGDWVEVVDDDYTFLGEAEPLLQVEDIDQETRVVTLSGTPTVSSAQPLTRHPLLRRWDSADVLNLEVPVPTANEGWLPLEDGIEIKFVPDSAGPYKTGDYWLIPARVATGDVEWPGTANNPDALPPHGVQHYYAPLAVISVTAGGIDSSTAPLGDCRRTFTPLAK